MSDDKKREELMKLLYSSVLGAGLVWWGEAVSQLRIGGEAPRAALCWSVGFGLFFLLYHTRFFIAAVSLAGMEYPPRALAHDMVDCVTLLLGFAALRLPSGKVDMIDPASAFAVAALIPMVALATWATPTWAARRTWILRVVAMLVAGIAAMCTWNSPASFDPQFWSHIVPLIGLWLLLVFYLLWPKCFRGAVSTNPPALQRVIGSFVPLIAVVGIVFCRIQIAPAARWVTAGTVVSFERGLPCMADPSIASQLAPYIEKLDTLKPARIRVVGSADREPLSPVALRFVGTNAELAALRARCIINILAKSNRFPGVELIPEVDHAGSSDSTNTRDRSVTLWAFTGRKLSSAEH